MTQENNKPVAKLRIQDIVFALWQNENGPVSFTLGSMDKCEILAISE